jgi:hypothetical protein
MRKSINTWRSYGRSSKLKECKEQAGPTAEHQDNVMEEPKENREKGTIEMADEPNMHKEDLVTPTEACNDRNFNPSPAYTG